MFRKILITSILTCIYAASHSQCSVCTSCTTTSNIGCTYSVSSSSATNYTISSGEKLCITGGTYTGKVTFNSSATAVIDGGAAFDPASTSISGTGNILEIKSGSTAIIPGFNISSNDGLTVNNCGTTNLTAISKVSSSSTLNVNNNGTLSSNNDFKYSSGSDGNICNSGIMTMVNLTMSDGTNSLVNNGTLVLSGNMSLSTDATVTLCPASYAEVDGNWNASTGATVNSPSSCGQIKVRGTSNCSGCNMTGYVDFCDTSGAAVTNTPHVDNNSGGSWAATMTYCTCNTVDALPVTLLDFTAQQETNKVLLEWITGSEINNDYFTVERSANGTDYSVVAKVKGAGNSTVPLIYQTFDEEPVPGVSFYKLTQTDYDGRSVSFSPIALSTVKNTLIYPNPTGNTLNMYISSTGPWCNITIYDISEKLVFAGKQDLKTGMNALSLDLSSLSNSMYIIKVETTEGTFFDKFVKGGE